MMKSALRTLLNSSTGVLELTAASDLVKPRPNIILQGGPVESEPPHTRVRYIADRTDRYKLFKGNRYEHFVPSAETLSVGGEDLQVFVWSHRTYVAE